MSLVNFSCLRNVSQESITDIGWLVDHPDDPNFDLQGNGYATSVIVSLFFLIGVPWNLFVIITIVRKKLYSNPAIMLLLNLAITNLLLDLLVMPFNIITGFSGEYLFGSSDAVRCRVCQTGIFLILLPWVSMHTLSLMSVDRFIFLKWPLDYNLTINPRRLLIAVAIVWILCTVISLPPLFGFGEIKFSFTVATCVPQLVGRTHIAPNYYYILFLLAEAFLPLISLIVMYIWVVCIVRKSIVMNSQRSLINRTDTKGDLREEVRTSITSERRNVQLRLVRVFVVIFTANLLTWLPMAILAVTSAAIGSGSTPTVMFTIVYLSFLSQTVIHPILEACLIRELRVIMSGYLNICGKTIKCCQRREENVTSTSSWKEGRNDSELTRTVKSVHTHLPRVHSMSAC